MEKRLANHISITSILLMGFLLLLTCWLHLGAQEQSPLVLQVKNREIVVNGKKSQVYEIAQSNGTQGLFLKKGELFNVILENQLDVPTGIHWHGLILPNNQDGVSFVTQPPIPPGGKYPYRFPLVQAGTFWMHAHYGLQEQKLLAAPLILYEAQDQVPNRQEVVMFLSDFTFRTPSEVFKELKSQDKGNMSSSMSGKQMMMIPDLNDVTYDAFLTNWRTLSDPQVIEVIPEKEVLLRIINGSSSSNFFIHLGKLQGEAIAIDGSPIIPLVGSRFEIGVAQRIDVVIKLPSGSDAHPILAQCEGTNMQTGLFLVTAGATRPAMKEKSDQQARAISYLQEFSLKARTPLPKKKIDRRLLVNLEGDMSKYIWLINGKAWPNNDPLTVKEGERVEMVFINHTSMSHPMHLHGHVFQITEINGIPLNGALRDTILVLPKSTVKVQFDAVHPGNWPLHCHNLYHQYAGMMITVNYEGFQGPHFSKSEIEQEEVKYLFTKNKL